MYFCFKEKYKSYIVLRLAHLFGAVLRNEDDMWIHERIVYKLRMMGIKLYDEPTYIYGDSQSASCDTGLPNSKSRKMSTPIAYYFVREWCVPEMLTHHTKSYRWQFIWFAEYADFIWSKVETSVGRGLASHLWLFEVIPFQEENIAFPRSVFLFVMAGRPIETWSTFMVSK